MNAPRILVTGATGYVGGRLVPQLLKRECAVRCLSRNPANLEGRRWEGVEIVQGDALKPDTLEPALKDIDIVYYLIHSLLVGVKGFADRDRKAAANFASAARSAGVKRIIYLGGLGRDEDVLSPHLYSRHEVGRILRMAGLSVTEFRAAIIVGSGSISFQIIRYITERLPLILAPRSVMSLCQPIAIQDVLAYLLAALDEPRSADHVIDIGGSDILTFRDLILRYAGVRGLTRKVIPLRGLSARLAARFVGALTPVPKAFAVTLMEGLKNEVVCRNQLAHTIFPSIHPIGYEEAVRLALKRITEGSIETVWSYSPDLLGPGRIYAHALETKEGMIIETNQQDVDAPAGAVYGTFCSLGGKRGWLVANWAWKLRAALDRLVGGLGMRRGRRIPDKVVPGDVVDFWRVEKVDPNHLLRLRAEMKLPGAGWLQFEVAPKKGEPDRSTLTQTVYFEPRGLWGHLYWYLLHPIHKPIFLHLCKRIKQVSEHAFCKFPPVT